MADASSLLDRLAAMASPHRLRIVAALAGGRNYVSQLARDVGLSRPLLQMHIQKLEAAGLVRSQLELSADGKAMKFYEISFDRITVTPDIIVAAVRALPEAAE